MEKLKTYSSFNERYLYEESKERGSGLFDGTLKSKPMNTLLG